MELDEVLSRITDDGIEFVRFEQSDLHGISRSKTVPARHVAGFDVRDDGRIVFTNGYDILELDGAQRRTLARQEHVAHLSAV